MRFRFDTRRYEYTQTTCVRLCLQNARIWNFWKQIDCTLPPLLNYAYYFDDKLWANLARPSQVALTNCYLCRVVSILCHSCILFSAASSAKFYSVAHKTATIPSNEQIEKRGFFSINRLCMRIWGLIWALSPLHSILLACICSVAVWLCVCDVFALGIVHSHSNAHKMHTRKIKTSWSTASGKGRYV